MQYLICAEKLFTQPASSTALHQKLTTSSATTEIARHPLKPHIAEVRLTGADRVGLTLVISTAGRFQKLPYCVT